MPAWTSHGDELALLSAAQQHGAIEVEEVGRSVGGRPIHAVYIGGAGRAADVMFLGAIHGTEPAGREALLDLVSDLGAGVASAWERVGHARLVIIPTGNPDGRASNERTNVNGVDLNRDFVDLSQPETRAIQSVIRDQRPATVVDLHEYIGLGNPTSDVEVRAPSSQVEAHPAVNALGPPLQERMMERLGSEGWTVREFPSAQINNPTVMIYCAPLQHSNSLLVETNRNSGFTEANRHLIQKQSVDEVLGWWADSGDDATQASIASRVSRPGASYQLRNGAVISPTPTAYALTATQAASVATQVGHYAIAMSDGVATMSQEAWRLIPVLFDVESQDRLVNASRVMDDGAAPGEGVTVGRPRVAIAGLDPEVRWIACDLVSGWVIAEVPEVKGVIGRALCEPWSGSLAVSTSAGRRALPPDLLRMATRPGRTLLVAVVNQVPSWAGIPLVRSGGSDGSVRLGLVTPEGYLGRRFVRDHRWVQRDQVSVIAAGLARDAEPEGIDLFVDAPVSASGRLRDGEYLDMDDATVLTRMQELSELRGGPEFTVDVDWWDRGEYNRIRKVLRIRDRIGGESAAVFTSHGSSSTEYQLDEDWSEGRAANDIIAQSDGEGEDRPRSSRVRDEEGLAEGTPRYESRYSPGSNITRQSILDSHAARELAASKNGATVLRLRSRWDAYPRLGVDWDIGDDVSWDLTGNFHPGGLAGSGRVIGWELDLGSRTVVPIVEVSA